MNRIVRIYKIHNLLVEFFYKNKAHRIHGPARIWCDGREEWWKYGVKHRDNKVLLLLRSIGNHE